MTTSTCRAKDPSTCPYHRPVYGLRSAKELKEVISSMELYSEALRYRPGFTAEASKAEEALERLAHEYDATDEGYAELDSEHARYSSIVDAAQMSPHDFDEEEFYDAKDKIEELEERLKYSIITRTVRYESQVNVDEIRNSRAPAGEGVEDISRKRRMVSALRQEYRRVRDRKEEMKTVRRQVRPNVVNAVIDKKVIISYDIVLNELAGFIKTNS